MSLLIKRSLILLALLSLQSIAADAPKNGKPKAKLAVTPTVTIFKGDVSSGKQLAYSERCQECHAEDGRANIGDGAGRIGKFPRLAGQKYDYLVKQLHDFREGRRHNDEMYILSRNLDEQDLHDIVAYFSSLPAAPSRPSSQLENAWARNVFQQGDAKRGVPACVSCHSPDRTSALANVPNIEGQHERYLNRQMLDWRSKERSNSTGGVMNTIAGALSEAEIAALARYISER